MIFISRFVACYLMIFPGSHSSVSQNLSKIPSPHKSKSTLVNSVYRTFSVARQRRQIQSGIIQFQAPFNFSDFGVIDYDDPSLYEVVTEMTDKEFESLGFPLPPKPTEKPPRDLIEDFGYSNNHIITLLSRKYVRQP